MRDPLGRRTGLTGPDGCRCPTWLNSVAPDASREATKCVLPDRNPAHRLMGALAHLSATGIAEHERVGHEPHEAQRFNRGQTVKYRC